MVIGGSVLSAMLFYAPAAVADDFDTETVTNTTGSSQSILNVVLSGNVASDVDATLNPFGTSGSVFSFYYSGNNTTTFSFSGTAIGNLSSATVGLSDTIADQIIGKYWGGTSTNPVPSGLQMPAPTITTKISGTGGSLEYLVLAANFELSGGQTAIDWYEQPVKTGQSVEVQMLNNDMNNDNADEPLAVSNARYFISPTLIPLDQLNLDNYPPTDSQFAPLPGVTDGTVINPGFLAESNDITVPEPSAALLLVSGIPALLAWRLRTGRNA